MTGGAARGLPGQLPPGERVLWQGAPNGAALARAAFHTRGVAIYFGILTAIGLGVAIAHRSAPLGALATAGCGAAAVALFHLLGMLNARSAVYTLTERRIVLRIGMALPTSINLPLTQISAVELSSGGDIALKLANTPPLGWFVLWPHARPWRLARPEPMLRCLPDAPDVAARIGRACLALAPEGQLRTAGTMTASAADTALPEAVAA